MLSILMVLATVNETQKQNQREGESEEVAAIVAARSPPTKGFRPLLGKANKDGFDCLSFPPLGVPPPLMSLCLGSSVPISFPSTRISQKSLGTHLY